MKKTIQKLKAAIAEITDSRNSFAAQLIETKRIERGQEASIHRLTDENWNLRTDVRNLNIEKRALFQALHDCQKLRRIETNSAGKAGLAA